MDQIYRNTTAALIALFCVWAPASYAQNTLIRLGLDEGSGTVALDSSGLGNDGSLLGGALYDADTPDGSAFALRLDGSNDWIDLGNLDVAGSGLTLAVWFKADSFPGGSQDPRLISKATGLSGNDHVFMLSTIASNGATRLRARVRVGGNTTTLIASSGDLTTGVWQHAALTHDGAVLRLYLNGTEVGSTALVGAVDVAPSVGVAVGSQPGGTLRLFDGLLDQVQILGRALGAGEVLALVSGEAEAPVALDDTYQTTPNLPLSEPAITGVLANDTDVDSGSLQAVLVTDVANGSLALNADGSFDYTPNLDFSGSDSFTYMANDGGLDSGVATVTITIASPPIATADSYDVTEDVLLVTTTLDGVLFNDTDTNGALDITAELVSGPGQGSFQSFGAGGGFSYLPAPDFVGVDSFVYRVVDGGSGASAEATVTLTVLGVNDAPVAVADAYTTSMDAPLAASVAEGVLANDTDADGDLVQGALVVDDVDHGTLRLNGDGSFNYTPDGGYIGLDTFTYTAGDGSVTSNEASVTIDIQPVVTAPADTVVQLSLDEGSGTVALDSSGLGNDGSLLGGALYDADTPDGSAFALRLDGSNDWIDLGNLDVAGSGLTLAVWFKADSFPGGSQDPRLISKATGLSGNDHVFMLSTIASNGATRLRARVRVGGNTTTLIASSGDLTTGVWQHAALTHDGAVLRLYLNGTEVGSTALVGAVDVAPSVGVAVGSQPGGTLRLFDGLLDQVQILGRALGAGEVLALVSGEAEAPVALDDTYQTTPNLPLSEPAITGVLANDTDVDSGSLQAVLVTDVANGSLALNADGSFDYTPNLDFSGSDSFTYMANDGGLDSGVATVTITIASPPIATADSYDVTEDVLLVTTTLDGVLFNDTDTNGALDITAELVSGPGQGSFQSFGAGGGFSYLPAPDFVGVDSFVYRVVDGGSGASAEATVTLTVLGVNDAPVAVADAYTTSMDAPLAASVAEGVLANDTDADGDLVQGALVVDDVDHGTLRLNGDGSFNYTPDGGYIGLDTFTYTAGDGSVTSNEASVTIDIQPVVTAPADTVVQLSLDEGSGTVALDSSGLGNDGSLLGGALYDADTPDGSAFALRLDGSNDWIDLGNLDVAGSGLTLAVWFKADSFPGGSQDPRLISKATGLSGNDHVFMLSTIASNGATRLRARVRVGGNTTTLIASSGDLTTGVWQHAALTHDGAVLRLYLNGTEVGSTALVGAVDVAPSVGVAVGSQPGGTLRLFDGLLDQVQILGRALGAGEVLALVSGEAEAPVALDDTYQTTPNLPLSEPAITGVLANDTDVDSGSLQAVLVTDVANGSLALNADGSFDYTPNLDFSGSDSFTYMANDGGLDSGVATVTITIASPPIATADSYDVTEDVLLVTTTLDGVLFNDTDTNGALDITPELVSGPSQGSLQSLGADGGFSYLPGADFVGVDSFVYRAVDGGNGASAEATVTLTVLGVNDAPVAVADVYTTSMDAPMAISVSEGVLENDADVDLDSLEAMLITDVGNGALTLNLDGSFTYLPNAGFFGPDIFVYQAFDGIEASASVSVTINIGGGPKEAPRIETGIVAFDREVIDTDVQQTHFAAGADLDRDGDVDLMATDFVQNSVYWFENDGNGAFAKRVLDDNLEGAYPGHLGDVNGDGEMDILAGGYQADTLVWYENNSAGAFTRRVIDSASDGFHSVITIDLDFDGDTDLITSSQDAGIVAWYENDGFENFSLRLIDATATGAKRADAADLDNDGDIDLFAASFFADEIAWYENDGFQGFTKRTIDAEARGAYFVLPADIDNDGRTDIVAAIQRQHAIVWYRNDGAGLFSRHFIDEAAIGARSVYVTDVDDDGDEDVLSASPDDNTVGWYENDGTGVFSARVVDQTVVGAYSVTATEVKDGGLLEVISGGRDDNSVSIHHPFKEHSLSVAAGESLDINSSVLRTTDPDTSAASLQYQLQTIPTHGELRLGGVALGTQDTFTQVDIDAGRLTYMHEGLPGSIDRFRFTVEDGQNIAIVGRFTIQGVNPNDFITHLRFDEGDGVVASDATGNGNDGVLLNGPVFEPASADGSPFSIRFDGLNDIVEMSGFDASGSGLSLSVRFRADTFPGSNRDPRLISKASASAANAHIFMLSTVAIGLDTRLRARIRIGGTTVTVVAKDGNIVEGDWYHAVLTHDGSVLRLYLDGVEVGGSPLAGVIDTDPSVAVAVGGQPSGAGGNFFDGLIDDVRIFQRALTESDVKEIFNESGEEPIYSPPQSLSAVPLSTSQVTLYWSLPEGESPASYSIYRDGILIANTIEMSHADLSVTPGVNHTYDVIAQYSSGGQSTAATAVATVLDVAAGAWWDAMWSYRVLLSAGTGDYNRFDRVVHFAIDFTAMFSSFGELGLPDYDTLRCHEVNVSGDIFTTDVPCQFDPGIDPDSGQMVVLMEGSTVSRSARYYHLYFDAIGGFRSPATSSSLVSVVDDVFDEDQYSYEITTPAARYLYQKQAGGFSSLLDADNADWISYGPTGGSAGNYRGIPNLVFPEGYFHPGSIDASSTLLRSGPVKSVIRSETEDGWEVQWEFYPRTATMTVLSAPENYWFLYEGTPGGSVNPSSDFSVTSDGTQRLLSQAWTSDLPNAEWIYFSDPGIGRSLFIAHHEDDDIDDSYRTMNGEMTVFGMGRQACCVSTLLEAVPNTFTIGLIETTSFTEAEEQIESAVQPAITAVSNGVSAP